MPTFMERMRAPMLLGDGFDGSDTAGESDALSRAVAMNELGNFVNLGPRRRNLGGMGMTWGQQVAASVPKGRHPSGGRGNMNVVYDQRPEQFAKEMQLKNREVDAKLAMADAVNSIRQQQADTASQRAESYDFGVRNPMGRVVTERGGNFNLINPRTGAATDTGVASGTMSQQDQAADMMAREAARIQGASERNAATIKSREAEGTANRDARLAAIAAQQKGASARQDDAQNFRANQPRERAAAINNKAREVAANDPSMGAFLEFDPQGNFRFKDGTPEDTQKVITSRIYGPQARDINLGKGSDASSLNNRGGGATTVRMVAPDGRVLNVPANRVQEMESKGAKRQ